MNLMKLIDAYAEVYADTWQDGGADWSEARTAVVEAVEKLERDAARWDFYRKQTGPDAPNPFWCLRVIDGELDRMVDAAMEATNGQGN